MVVNCKAWTLKRVRAFAIEGVEKKLDGQAIKSPHKTCGGPDNTVKSYSTVLLPNKRERTNKTRKMKNKTLAMPAAPAAMPPNPKMAAIMATIRKMTVQRNILIDLLNE